MPKRQSRSAACVSGPFDGAVSASVETVTTDDRAAKRQRGDPAFQPLADEANAVAEDEREFVDALNAVLRQNARGSECCLGFTALKPTAHPRHCHWDDTLLRRLWRCSLDKFDSWIAQHCPDVIRALWIQFSSGLHTLVDHEKHADNSAYIIRSSSSTGRSEVLTPGLSCGSARAQVSQLSAYRATVTCSCTDDCEEMLECARMAGLLLQSLLGEADRVVELVLQAAPVGVVEETVVLMTQVIQQGPQCVSESWFRNLLGCIGNLLASVDSESSARSRIFVVSGSWYAVLTMIEDELQLESRTSMAYESLADRERMITEAMLRGSSAWPSELSGIIGGYVGLHDLLEILLWVLHNCRRTPIDYRPRLARVLGDLWRRSHLPLELIQTTALIVRNLGQGKHDVDYARDCWIENLLVGDSSTGSECRDLLSTRLLEDKGHHAPDLWALLPITLSGLLFCKDPQRRFEAVLQVVDELLVLPADGLRFRPDFIRRPPTQACAGYSHDRLPPVNTRMPSTDSQVCRLHRAISWLGQIIDCRTDWNVVEWPSDWRVRCLQKMMGWLKPRLNAAANSAETPDLVLRLIARLIAGNWLTTSQLDHVICTGLMEVAVEMGYRGRANMPEWFAHFFLQLWLNDPHIALSNRYAKLLDSIPNGRSVLENATFVYYLSTKAGAPIANTSSAFNTWPTIDARPAQ
jgi:hypothetical protein